jgi:hypothetical protein
LPQEPLFPTLPENIEAGEYELKNLDFNFDLGDVRIITGEEFELIYGNNNARRLYYERKNNGTWIIGSNKVRWNWFWPWNYRHNDIKLTVVLPRDFVAEDMAINMGAGNMQVQYLCARKLLLDVGVGNCRVDSLHAEDAKISVGLGYLGAQRFTTDKAKLDVGFGNIELSLARPLEQYRCYVSVGLGNVRLGGNNYSGVAEVASGAADATYSLDIDCGLGNVVIQAQQTAQI